MGCEVEPSAVSGGMIGKIALIQTPVICYAMIIRVGGHDCPDQTYASTLPYVVARTVQVHGAFPFLVSYIFIIIDILLQYHSSSSAPGSSDDSLSVLPSVSPST